MLTRLYRLLSSPGAYIVLQKILAADRLRMLCLDRLKLRQGERVVDVGCGPGYILDYMPNVELYGFDTKPDYIDYANKTYGDRGLFFCEIFGEGRARQLAPYDAVMLFGLLHHVDDTAAHELLRDVTSGLKSEGRVVCIDQCFTPDQGAVSKWVAKCDRGKFVRQEHEYRLIAEPFFADIRTEILHNVTRIPSASIIMQLYRPKPPAAY